MLIRKIKVKLFYLRVRFEAWLVSKMICRCGSGAHPRMCWKHPGAYHRHIESLNAEGEADQIEELEAELEAREEEISNLYEENSELRGQLEDLEHDLESRDEETSRLNDKIWILEDQVSELRGQLEDLECELREAEREKW